MAVDMKKARDVVYELGTVFERALFAYLFQDGSAERVQQCLLTYKNPDNGFGHALEHDIRTPDSNPLALEYLLTVIRFTELPVGSVLDGTAAWVLDNQQEDGFLKNPPSVLDYPHAPWWQEGGQNMPDSIVGNLIALGKATPRLIDNTRNWVFANLTLDTILQTEWLFMLYHAKDYYFADEGFPEVEKYRQAVIDRIIKLAEDLPPEQYGSFFAFAPKPDSSVAQAAPEDRVKKFLDHLENTQKPEGCWNDQHNLTQWYSYTTISALLTLRRYGRLR